VSDVKTIIGWDKNVINYTYLYHHIVVLDRYTNSNLVYYRHSRDDEPYDLRAVLMKIQVWDMIPC